VHLLGAGKMVGMGRDCVPFPTTWTALQIWTVLLAASVCQQSVFMTGAWKFAVEPAVQSLVSRCKEPLLWPSHILIISKTIYFGFSQEQPRRDERVRQSVQRKMPEQFGLKRSVFSGGPVKPTWFVTWGNESLSCAAKAYDLPGKPQRDRTRFRGHDRFARGRWFLFPRMFCLEEK